MISPHKVLYESIHCEALKCNAFYRPGDGSGSDCMFSRILAAISFVHVGPIFPLTSVCVRSRDMDASVELLCSLTRPVADVLAAVWFSPSALDEAFTTLQTTARCRLSRFAPSIHYRSGPARNAKFTCAVMNRQEMPAQNDTENWTDIRFFAAILNLYARELCQ